MSQRPYLFVAFVFLGGWGGGGGSMSFDVNDEHEFAKSGSWSNDFFFVQYKSYYTHDQTKAGPCPVDPLVSTSNCNHLVNDAGQETNLEKLVPTHQLNATMVPPKRKSQLHMFTRNLQQFSPRHPGQTRILANG